jgi:hypothetical protein
LNKGSVRIAHVTSYFLIGCIRLTNSNCTVFYITKKVNLIK